MDKKHSKISLITGLYTNVISLLRIPWVFLGGGGGEEGCMLFVKLSNAPTMGTGRTHAFLKTFLIDKEHYDKHN